MANEDYKYWLRASAGGTTAILKIFDNNQVECQFQWSAMGNSGFHYLLSGKHELISETYGLIHIYRVEDMLQTPTVPLPIEALGAELIYEYVKLPQSSSWRHPEDALWIGGRWNEFFDLILFANDFVVECFDGLKYAIAEGIIKEVVEPPELVESVNDAFLAHLAHLIIDLDKTKFSKIER